VWDKKAAGGYRIGPPDKTISSVTPDSIGMEVKTGW
jgi:hypothetical protein